MWLSPRGGSSRGSALGSGNTLWAEAGVKAGETPTSALGYWGAGLQQLPPRQPGSFGASPPTSRVFLPPPVLSGTFGHSRPAGPRRPSTASGLP